MEGAAIYFDLKEESAPSVPVSSKLTTYRSFHLAVTRNQWCVLMGRTVAKGHGLIINEIAQRESSRCRQARNINSHLPLLPS